MSTVTPIIVAEDIPNVALGARSALRRGSATLGEYGSGPIQVVASGQLLLQWLEDQPPSSVRLILLDYGLTDGPSTNVVAQVRNGDGMTRHPALHSDALMIGWSAHPEAPAAFQDLKLDGWISKHRSITNLAQDVAEIIQRRKNGEIWVELLV